MNKGIVFAVFGMLVLSEGCSNQEQNAKPVDTTLADEESAPSVTKTPTSEASNAVEPQQPLDEPLDERWNEDDGQAAYADAMGEAARSKNATRAEVATNEPIGPVPLGDRGNWVTPDDYPPAAAREDREGIVGFTLSVGRDGRPTSCDVTSTSGSPDLDAGACDTVMRRARFRPAQDATGSAIEGRYFTRVRWTL